MAPPAPGLLSTITGCFHASESFLPRARANTSLEPLGGYGTMIVTARAGNCCAQADAAESRTAAIQSLFTVASFCGDPFSPKVGSMVPVDALADFAAAAFERVGLRARDARVVADLMAEAELQGS